MTSKVAQMHNCSPRYSAHAGWCWVQKGNGQGHRIISNSLHISGTDAAIKLKILFTSVYCLRIKNCAGFMSQNIIPYEKFTPAYITSRVFAPSQSAQSSSW